MSDVEATTEAPHPPEPPTPPLAPLPLARHLNGLVVGGLLTTLTIPIGSTVAAYASAGWPNLLSAASALTAFCLLAVGLRLGPTRDSWKAARRGVPAVAVVEQVATLPMTLRKGTGRPAVAQVVRLDLRVEAEGEPVTRVRLRRWARVDRIEALAPGAVLPAKVLPGWPQDPALRLRR